MQNSSLVSIIVPVYNTETYLRPCLDSILQQKHANFELLLIDDGSTDGSAEICERYAHEDGRIRVIHQANCGVSAARNSGLRAAAGAYIAFVDSDDTVAPEHISNMVELIKDGSDIACSPIKTDLPGSRRIALSGIDALKNIIYQGHEDYMWYSVNKLFSRKAVDQVFFMEDEQYGEDFSFLWKTFLHAATVTFGTKKTYHYRQSASSVNYAAFDKRHLTYFLVSERFSDFVKENNIALEKEAAYVKARVLYRLLNIMLQGGKDRQLYSDFVLKLKKSQHDVYSNTSVPFGFKIKLFLKVYFDKFYYVLWRIMRHFER